MESEKWIIKNCTIVNPEYGEIKADLKIENGTVAAIGKDLCAEDCSVYDASGKYLFPGFIDTHVHLGNFNSFEDDCRTETGAGDLRSEKDDNPFSFAGSECALYGVSLPKRKELGAVFSRRRSR